MDKALLHACKGMRPADCDRLTLSEIEFLLSDPKDHDPDGTPAMSDAEIAAHRRWWLSLTPTERLEQAR